MEKERISSAVHGLCLLGLSGAQNLILDFFRVCKRKVLLTDILHGLLHFLIRDKGSLHAHRLRNSLREEEHISFSEQFFRTDTVQNGPRVNARGDRKRDARRDIRLDEAGNDIDTRALGCDNKMHTGCTRKLCDAANSLLHLVFRDHHEIGQLIDDDDKLRQGLRQILGRHAAACGGRSYSLIVAAKIPDTGLRKLAIAIRHLRDRPVERSGSLLRVRDDRNQKMRDAVVDRELNDLRVYHDELHFLRPIAVEYAHNQRVDTDRLTGTRRTRNQEMRHLCDVGDHGLSRNVLSDRKIQFSVCLLKALALQ